MNARQLLTEMVAHIIRTKKARSYDDIREYLHMYPEFEDAYPEMAHDEWMAIVHTQLSK